MTNTASTGQILRFFCLLGMLVGASAFAADPHTLGLQTRTWRIAHEREIIAEFVELLAIPDLASDKPNIERNAEAIRAMFEKRGAKTQLLRIDDAPPIVVADVIAPGATRTVGIYAHYDGQPVDPSKWKSDPWKPVMRDANGKEIDWQNAKSFDPESRLYARAAGDDKTPIIASAAALDAMHANGTPTTVNLRFVFEGEEEAGSPHLGDYLAKFANVLRPSAWILCDGPVHQSRRMEMFFGARGVVDLELTIYGPIKALHDGHYGSWVPNPIVRLTHLLDSMRDESGKILIAGFDKEFRAPTEAERAALRNVPDVDDALRKEFAIAQTLDGSVSDSVLQPALNIRGIESGRVGAQAANSIPTEARASIDFRLVPNQTPESVRTLVERHIEKQGYTIVRDVPDAATRLKFPKIARVNWGAGYPPARTSLELPLSKEIADIMTAAGHEPVKLPTLGGSIPMYLFQQPDDTPVIDLPIANHDDNQHAADENLRLQNLWDGIEVYAVLFATLSPK
ncbi:MAG: M20/M25/M40 family metallo-hydrolase [Chthoniobacterales bacterium]